MSTTLEDRVAELEALLAQMNASLGTVQRGLDTIQENSDEFNTGDIAWVLVASGLVIFMTLPGLALFYSGMVRIQNVLATVMQSVSIACLITVLWFICGYSLTFTPVQESTGCKDMAIIGNLDRLFLDRLFINDRHQLQQNIPETLFCMYQLSFAVITPALICGAFADRMKYNSMLFLMGAWHLLVYCPIHRWNQHPCGFLYHYSIDFAGGNSIHVSAGMAGMVCALMIGNRSGYGKEHYLPHNVLISVMGACMLWVGWFGFNAGSALGANSVAALALLNTQISAGCAGLTWMFVEWLVRGQPSVLGMVSGAIGGFVCVTPAAGVIDPLGVSGLRD
jgi:ammonium transporter, Amt family